MIPLPPRSPRTSPHFPYSTLFRSKLDGARPLVRLIQEKIKQPLSYELLFGKLVHGGEVKVKMKTGEDAKVGNPLAFEITPAPPKSSKGKPKADKAKTAAE